MHVGAERKQQYIENYSRLISVGLLAAGVAHEISNPTAFIKSNTLYLKKEIEKFMSADNLSREQHGVLQEFLDILQENSDGVNRIERLVKELKSYSRAVGKTEPLNLESVLESALVLVWNRLKYKAEIQKDFLHPPLVIADYGKLEEVAINLLTNAADAIEIRGKVILRTFQRAGHSCFQVEVTGSGIPKDRLEDIFRPFVTTKGKKGTGLGLYLCRKILDELGGSIEVSSTVGQGTCFTVCLPHLERGPD